MLARDGSEVLLEDDQYVFEPKLDGIRALVYSSGSDVHVRSRSDRDVTSAYPELQTGDLAPCVLDGEIVLYDEAGNPDFGALLSRHQRKIAPSRGRPVSLAVFDVLEVNGRAVVGLPLEDRKALLEEIMSPALPRFQNTIWTEEGRRLWDLMRQRGLEGVIAKRKGSLYRPGERSHDWRKIKVFATADVVISGYRADRRALSSLEVGAYDAQDRLVPLGRVGTGFNDASARILRSALDTIRTGETTTSDSDIVKVEPRLVAEVRYLHRTRDGSLRHASFMRIRSDKSPEECRLADMTL
jgi:bifunctional non-homologous end joining protein LigD